MVGGVSVAKFKRGLNNRAIDLLAAEAAKGGWWADVLADPTLLVAIRDGYLNVYWRGQSLFYVKSNKSGLKVTTHEKYLLDPTLASQVSLKNREFDVANLLKKGFISHYEGKATLDKMKKASGHFSGLEKTGCHEIAIRNDSVIDREIAFPGFVSSDAGSENESGQVDLACVERDGQDVRLVFWEAKHYSNKELRADLRAEDELPPVCGQVKKYQAYLSAHREAVLGGYTAVARNLVALRDMKWVRPLSPLIVEVGTGKRCLVLDDEPKVGLIIFGFDKAGKEHGPWKEHLRRLEAKIHPVYAVGDAKGVRLPPRKPTKDRSDHFLVQPGR